jgi:hypothetical protein
MRRWLVLLLSTAAPVLVAADAERGEALYRQTCASCHGNNPAIGSPATVAYDPDGLLEAMQVIPQMNFLQNALSATDREDITEYIGSVVGAPPVVEPQRGWYWNPAESGRGFFLEKRAGNLFMAAFHYDAQGRATWFTGQGAVASSSFLAPMSTFAGGQTLTGPYQAPVATASPGDLVLDFLSTSTTRLTWPGGVVTLTRFPVAGGSSPQPAQLGAPESGWWWNPSEAGRGYAIEFQGDQVFVAGFMYADDGAPIWYVSAGPMQTPTVYVGRWITFVDGQAMGAPYRAPTLVQPDAGPLALSFSDSKHGTLTLPDGRVIALTRFEF